MRGPLTLTSYRGHTGGAVPTISVNEAGDHLSDIVRYAQQYHEDVVLTQEGRPAAVVVAADRYAAIAATVETVSDPGVLAGLNEALVDVRNGRVRDWQETFGKLYPRLEFPEGDPPGEG